MHLDDFEASLQQPTPPPGISLALQSLWYAANGDWNRAHDLTQPGGPELDWVHAYLHRVEGDISNARYWYRRAGKPPVDGPLQEEWADLVTVLLEK